MRHDATTTALRREHAARYLDSRAAVNRTTAAARGDHRREESRGKAGWARRTLVLASLHDPGDLRSFRTSGFSGSDEELIASASILPIPRAGDQQGGVTAQPPDREHIAFCRS
jgi:hypothetical protein